MEFEYADRIHGTSLQGYVSISGRDLIRIFDEPNSRGDGGYKVQWEWNLIIDGEVITIYDWKSGAFDIDSFTDWHVGGRSSRAVQVLDRFLEDHGFRRVTRTGW